jgi:large subunit ribosomal protein L24e
MNTCTFCGTEIPVGTGKMYVKKDARILWFCSRRCEKNLLKLERNPRTTAYTTEARKAKKQQMAALAHAEERKEEQAAPVEKKAPAKKAAKAKQ